MLGRLGRLGGWVGMRLGGREADGMNIGRPTFLNFETKDN